MSMVYHEADGDLSVLHGKQVAVIGYGNMGRPIALNLRDSGVSLAVSEPNPERHPQVTSEGFTVTPIAEAVRNSRIVMVDFRGSSRHSGRVSAAFSSSERRPSRSAITARAPKKDFVPE